MNSKLFKDSLVVGLALFAMFFGAGNIIFPPYIGVVSGGSWLLGFVAYFFADIGLALLALVALLQSGTIDTHTSIMTRLGYWPSRILMFCVFVSICYIAAPRTGTVSYELAVVPVFGEKASLPIYSICYFVVAWFFSVRESKVVDYVGKILTPVLVAGLVIMIIIGIVTPLGPIAPEAKIGNVWYLGLISGYQTLDATAAVIFAYIVSQALTAKGYNTPALKIKSVLAASWVVGVLMFIVYGGLCYLGATASTMYGADIPHGALVVDIFQRLLGYNGAVMLGVVTTLACLTTCIAVISALSSFLVRLSEGRLKYNVLATLIAFSFGLLANLGLSTILAIAVPVLLIVYPAVLVMVILSLFDKRIKNANIFKISVGFALIFAIMEVSLSFGFEPANIITVLPLQAHGFGWVVPAAAGALLGYFIKPQAQAA